MTLFQKCHTEYETVMEVGLIEQCKEITTRKCTEIHEQVLEPTPGSSAGVPPPPPSSPPVDSFNGQPSLPLLRKRRNAESGSDPLGKIYNTKTVIEVPFNPIL